MTIDPGRLMALDLPPHEFAWTERDCLLYAVATGYGQDPLDERELRFVLEGPRQLVSPTNAMTLYYDDRWMHESGVDLAMSVHGEQRQIFHQVLRPSGRARVSSHVTGIFDKGVGRGLLVQCEQVLQDYGSGEPLVTNIITNFARADGGIGYSSGPTPAVHPLPTRAADIVIDRRTRPEQALLYRLCGDRNPLHAVPSAAKSAGFHKPILHGMCTYGFAARALLEGVCEYDPARLRSLAVRLSAPTYPGDLLHTEIWRDGSVVSFRTSVPERDGVVVLNNGRAEIEFPKD